MGLISLRYRITDNTCAKKPFRSAGLLLQQSFVSPVVLVLALSFSSFSFCASDRGAAGMEELEAPT
jgi:hypothetical protein